MPGEPVTTLVCPACAAEVRGAGEDCPQCGASLTATSEPGRQGTGGHPPAGRVVDAPWFVLLITFGALAVFGLPLLWVSRGFSRPAKVFWTLIVLGYTALLLWLTWLALAWTYTLIRESLAEFP